MQSVLIIYDNTGHIFDQKYGDVAEPQGGIQFKRFDVPDGQYVLSVDVSVVPHVAVLSPAPRDLVAEKLEELEERMGNTENLCWIALEGAADTYEAVEPFLPE
jgi:hypothetical protein